MPGSARPEVDANEATRLWDRFTEIDEKVGEIDKSVGILTTEVHGLRAGMSQLNSSLGRIADDVAKSTKELAEEISRSKSPNWQMLQVIGPTLFSILTFMGFVFYREIDHTRGEIRHAEEMAAVRDDHNDHIQNLKNQSQVEVTDLKIENAALKAKP